MISIRPASNYSYAQLSQLQVHSSQTSFIESVADCLKEAQSNPIWNTWAILNDEVLIGFAMSGDWDDEQRTWLDRFLIDFHYQNKGFGKIALYQLIELLIEDSLHQQLFLSLYDDNTKALQLYQSFGFYLTQQKDINNEQIMVLTLQEWNKRKRSILHNQ